MTDGKSLSHTVRPDGSLPIRPLRPCEAEGLMRLRHQAIRECATHFGTPPEIELGRNAGDYRRQLLNHRRSGQAALLGLWERDRLRGMAGVRSTRSGNTTFGLIYSMYVAPELRGLGRGRALLEASMRHLRTTWRLDTFRMNVEIHNQAALDLYLHCGFEILRTETGAFRIDGRWHDVYLLERRPAE